MATLALSRDLLDDFVKLQKSTQAAVHKLADQFQKLSAAELRSAKGIHLERYNQQLDDRARTIRIDDSFRGVVLDAGDDRLFILTRIDTHDKVDQWIVHNRFRVNEAVGALEIHNPAAISDVVASIDTTLAAEVPKLFAHRKAKEFRQLGVDESLMPALRAFTDEDQLEALLGVLPQNQADALIMLIGDEDVEVLYSQIAGDISPDDIDPSDLLAAVAAPASRQLFHIVTDEAELQEMLAQPLALWRTYLHHTQHDLAYREIYSGPVRVTGGAGTGKTVVAMHRARFLSDRVAGRSGKPILFTTFTRNLAEAIERDLRTLGGADVLDVVEVINVDSLAHRIVSGSEPDVVGIARDDEVRQLWADVVDELGLPFAPEFLNTEFEQVVLAQGIGSRADYFNAVRAGRGVRLTRRDRAEVWKGIESFLRELTSRNRRTHLQMADAAAGYLAARTVKPYHHILVDEAQDLHEAQWRMLRAAVPERTNDLFIVGDAHQRIYDRRTSLSQVGIKVTGRSRRLRINYRTTHEILRWALALLGEGSYDDLDQGTESQTLATYHSFLHGRAPTMIGAKAKHDEMMALVDQVKRWIDDGAPEEEIAVAARAGGALDPAAQALGRAGLAVALLGADLPRGDGVRLGTMHRLKGVEFRCVALVDFDDDSIPSRWAVTDRKADPVQHEADLRRERCTAYVAATRARDDLWVGWSGKPSRFLVPLLGGAAMS
jgi:superfamily I DNA/RNA helicase